MDSWEYGSVVEKISADMPEADENDSWNLQNGQTYSQDTFYQPKVSAKFFNSKVTFDVKLSFTTQQVMPVAQEGIEKIMNKKHLKEQYQKYKRYVIIKK